MRTTWLTHLGFFLAGASAFTGQAHTVVKEYDRGFITYPYSDPDPVPRMTRFYPYFRYDGFTAQPLEKKWKVVELSNDYLQLLILPEIGGKIWAAIDKTTGQSLVYFNHVIKFRDISMRGPWTSGGMEPNYGIIGHAPTCFAPVDYLVQHHRDGSASCLVGALDLLTRTRWCLEIKLEPHQACFSTRSFWYNASPDSQPYYSWMNVGIKAAGNLEFISPGTQYLYHDGLAYPWPTNSANGHNLAWYEQNDFGSYKSYHVLGRLSECFGGYWHDQDFGMAHWAPFRDKPGRKLWIWGLSRQGMLWEKLLSDSDGQYVEVQSGRFFNQADSQSSLTPFKHEEFPPHASDSWTEYWLPIKGIGGFVNASPWGALNIVQQNDGLRIRICPARRLDDKLEVFDGDQLLHTEDVHLAPMVPVERTVRLAAPPRALRVRVGGDKLRYSAKDDDRLHRPLESPADFDWNSVYGLYLKGKDSACQKNYSEAAAQLRSCLERDHNFAPALEELASLSNRKADFSAGADLAARALSIDTYDPGANYQFGLAHAGLGHHADAQAAFSLAALRMGWRSAAETELAKDYLRENRYEPALAAVTDALEANPRDLDALKLQACVHRLRGERSEAGAALALAAGLDPLDPLVRFEQCRLERHGYGPLAALVRNELPQETYLEIAAWYRNVGLDGEAAQALRLAPPTAEVLYWLAYLEHDQALLARAEATSPEFVFPFRPEAFPVFEWGAAQNAAWQPKYFLALLQWHRGEPGKARELLAACGEEPQFAPFYVARAQLTEETRLRDLRRAMELAPAEWRYGVSLANYYLQAKETQSALALARDYSRRFPSNDPLALLYAKCLLLTGDYQGTVNLLEPRQFLPSEGTTEARALFHEANVRLALDRLDRGIPAQAIPFIERARTWPENLGSGKPYPEDTDERLEDWLSYQVARRTQDKASQPIALKRIVSFSTTHGTSGSGEIISALAWKALGQAAEGEQLLRNWITAQPKNELARWGWEVFADHRAPLPSNVQDLGAQTVARCLHVPGSTGH